MPIDATLLRSEQDRLKLARWQSIRRTADNDLQLPNHLEDLVELNETTRTISRDIKAQRTLLHQLQQSLAPHKTKQPEGSLPQERRNAILEQIRDIKTKVIPSLELQFKEFSERFASKLCQLGNFVDEKILNQYPRDITITPLPSTNEQTLSIAGLSINQDGDVANLLQQAFVSYALDYVQQLKSASFQIHQQLHCDWLISKKDAHAMIGCHPSNCCICLSEKSGAAGIHHTDSGNIMIASSSFHCLSKRHEGKIYMESHLPMIEACLSTTSQPFNAMIVFALEEHGAASSTTESFRWPGQQLELLIVYNSPIDSLRPVRNFQSYLVNQIVEFYRSLITLPPNSEASNGYLRTRAVPPHLLLPCEASRIVIEGHYPHSSESVKPILLGYVSNCLDFVSRSRQVKSRLRPGEKAEFVYTLHVGWIVDTTAAWKWMSQNHARPRSDIAVQDSEQGANLKVPLVLRRYIYSPVTASLQSKHKSHRGNDAPASPSDATKIVEQKASSDKAHIPLEMMCNPFGFLPTIVDTTNNA